MDNYGMRQDAIKQAKLSDEIEIVDQMYHDGFTFNAIVEAIAEDFDISEDEAEIIVSEIMQLSS